MNSGGNTLRREALGIYLTLITDSEGDLGCVSIFLIGKMQLFVIKYIHYKCGVPQKIFACPNKCVKVRLEEERGIFVGNIEYHLST